MKGLREHLKGNKRTAQENRDTGPKLTKKGNTVKT